MYIFYKRTLPCLLALANLQAQQVTVIDSNVLSAIRAEAAQKHPASLAAAERLAASSSDILATRLWDDPTIRFGYRGARESRQRSEGDVNFGIEIPIPKPGLYAANLSKSEALNRAKKNSLLATRISSASDASTLAIELGLSQEILTLLNGELKWLKEMEVNANQMALNPTATSIDAIRISAEIAKFSVEITSAENNRDALASQLNLALSRPLKATLPSYRLPTKTPPVPPAASEIARIPYANPQFEAMREMTSASQADIRIADRERLPQLAISIDNTAYFSRSDHRETSVGVMMSIPWFNNRSNDAKVQSAERTHKANNAELEALRLDLSRQVAVAAAEAANASAQARAYAGEIREKAIQAN